ncbi:LysR family transcriptional regulator [Pseudorhodoplanes sp.]|uniref:LysR family transcriptional regulator n=1 Tax=Pseudorhodoplanes sp. TaxID=1934341 RepID=UPI003D0E775C
MHHLRVFEMLLHERSLTRAAKALDVTQPALSKTLSRLRVYFNDPLFVRVSNRMEPTPKALELARPIVDVLGSMRALRVDHAAFDPKTSARTFQFCVVDAGVIKLLPPLVERVTREAPHVRLRLVQLEGEHLESWLETGTIDFAMGSFPSLPKSIRRQFLWLEEYVSVVNRGHPRLSGSPSLREFAAENHVLVSTMGTGHSHKLAEQAVESAIPPERIVCRVPIFLAAAIVAKHTNAVATLPKSIATVLADDLNLEIIRPPIRLPKIDIFQYWHNRFHRDTANRWIRSVFESLFRERGHRPRT